MIIVILVTCWGKHRAFVWTCPEHHLAFLTGKKLPVCDVFPLAACYDFSMRPVLNANIHMFISAMRVVIGVVLLTFIYGFEPPKRCFLFGA